MTLAEIIPGDINTHAPTTRRGILSGFVSTEDGRADSLSPSNEITGQRLLDQFFISRELAEANSGVRDERLDLIRSDVRNWFEKTYPNIGPGKQPGADAYAEAKEADESMLGKLIQYLQNNHTSANGMSWAELLASRDFLETSYKLTNDLRDGVDLSFDKGSHAFVVPVRLSTRHPEYSNEIRPLVHAFHYVPDDLVPYFLRDLPPFVADRYVDGGFVIVAPVTDDMKRDLSSISMSAFIKAARERVNSAVDLAQAMGANEIGYGATYPGLMGLGEATSNKEVITTTGHGGTTALMAMLINEIMDKLMRNKQSVRIGILGLGQIGLPAAQVVAEFYPKNKINIFDVREDNARRLEGENPRYSKVLSVKQLIEDSDIILSSATATFNFSDPKGQNYIDIKDLSGKYFIDDSEPHSFVPDEIHALGGVVLDVIGRDYTGRILKRRSRFGYGGTLADRERDAFGCELEVGMLAHLRRELTKGGKAPQEVNAIIGRYALRRPVRAEDTRNWIDLFNFYGIKPAPFQAFGRLQELSRPRPVTLRKVSKMVSRAISPWRISHSRRSPRLRTT